MDSYSSSSKIQTVFLIDCANSRQDISSKDHVQCQWRAICLSCVRTLLFLTKFPNREHIKNVQWNWRLYSSKAKASTKLGATLTQFQNVTSHDLEEFFTNLRTSMQESKSQPLTSTPPIQYLYSALAASVQDYPWDAPEIASPVRQVLSHSRPHRRTLSTATNVTPKRNNFIFIFTLCPENEEELRRFCGISKLGPLKDCIGKSLLPAPLLSKLEEKGISVYWVYLNHSGLPLMKAAPALRTVSELLALTGGTLLPSTALTGPIHQVIPNSTKATADSATSKEDSVEINSTTHTLSPTEAHKTNTRTTEVLSSLFPSSAFLERYLRGQRSDRHKAKLDLAQDDKNVYWLSTTAGKLLCILELKKMYVSSKAHSSPLASAPPLSHPHHHSTRPHPHSTHPHSPVRSKRPHHHPEAQPLGKRRRLIKKKLSFSQISCSDTIEQQNPASIEKDAEIDPQNNGVIPQVAIVGVVKQIDLPLSFLCSTSSYSCSSVCIPRSLRAHHTVPFHTRAEVTVSDTRTKEPYQVEHPRCSITPPMQGVFDVILGAPHNRSANARHESLQDSSALQVETCKSLGESEDSLKSPLFTHTPQICLPRLPFTPPSRSFRWPFSSLRKRSKSVPIISSSVNMWKVMNRSLTVDIKRCVSVKKKPPSNSPDCRAKGQRAVSMSPRYPVLRLRNVLEKQKTFKPLPLTKIPHPKSCLAERRFHSKQFQTLCVWLAKNGYHLVVKVFTDCGTSSVAVLQPVTSLLATLTPIRPEHQTALFSKVVRLQGENGSSQSVSSLESKSTLGGVGMGTGNVDENHVWRSKVASDVELMDSISLLFSQSCKGDTAFMGDRSRDLPSFTNQSLLPWFSYSDHCGVSKATFNLLNSRIDGDSVTAGVSQARLGVVTRLRDVYRGRVTGMSGVHSLCQPSGESGSRVEESGASVSETEEVSKSATNNEPEEFVLSVTTIDELHKWFQEEYQEQVKVSLDQEMKGDSFQRWASSVVPKFAEAFATIVTSRGQPGSQPQSLDIQTRLWEELNGKVLISGTTLGEKYEGLFKSLHHCGENEKPQGGANETDGDIEDREEIIASQRVSEYLIQVFLRFEALKACPESCQDYEIYSDQLIFLLRKISLMSNPGLLGSLMKKVILPLYIDSCKSVLLLIYEGLMLPLPFDLDPNPDSEMESGGMTSQTEETGSSEDEYSLYSMEEPFQALRVPLLNTRKLARHSSFQETTAQRQIAVVNKKKKNKKSRKVAEKEKLNIEGPLSLQSSPLILKTSMKESSDKNRRNVCRNLFTRSHSICEGVASLKRRLSDEGSQVQHSKKKRTGALQRRSTLAADVLVKETPVKKQVENYQRFKLQRLRSKTTITSPDVIAIEESPRRSFYSRPKITRAPVLNPDSAIFKTPPLKDCRKKTSTTQLALNKEPSPAALHSLLHGEILSPTTCTVSTLQSGAQSVSNRSKVPIFESPLKRVSKAVATKSPELFGKVSESPVDHSPSDNCVIVGRTPSKCMNLSAPVRNSVTSEHFLWKPTVKSSVRTARMLTYDNENPVEKASTHTLESSVDETRQDSPLPTTTQNVFNSEQVSDTHLPREDVTILDIPSLYEPQASFQESVQSDKVFLVSSPETSSPQSCLLAGVDPIVENESASMMAFALCTPTKEDRKDFHQAFVDRTECID